MAEYESAEAIEAIEALVTSAQQPVAEGHKRVFVLPPDYKLEVEGLRCRPGRA